MTQEKPKAQTLEADKRDGDRKDVDAAIEKAKDLPEEKGGRGGPEPVRYGDWEIGGKCVDF